MNRKFFAIGCFIFILFVVHGPVHFSTYAPKILIYNATASVPVGWYIKLPMSNLEIGDYVVFDPPAEVKDFVLDRGYMTENELMMKQVGGLAGDHYCVIQSTHEFYAKGKYIGQVAKKDGQDRDLPVLDGDFVVPAGKFLPITTHPFSFDGRYFGSVDMSAIQYKVYPIPFLTDW